jgi:hypothetical protein
MAHMHFITASGQGFSLNSRQYRNIAWALHDGQIAEERLLSAQKETPYPRYRAKRLGDGAGTFPAQYALTTCHSSQKEMDRLDDSSFASLDGVILALSQQPTPRGCLKLKWLLPELRIIRGANCVVVYAISTDVKRLQILKVTYWGKKVPKTAVTRAKLARRPPSQNQTQPTSAKKEAHSPIDLDWQGGYSGQTAGELLSFEEYGRTDLLVAAFTQAIQEKAERRRRLSDAERVVLAVGKLDATMVTDGFDNFFRYSPQLAENIVESLQRIGCKRLAKATQRALDALHVPRLKAEQITSAMQRRDVRRDQQLSECSTSYCKTSGPALRLLGFIKANKDTIRF